MIGHVQRARLGWGRPGGSTAFWGQLTSLREPPRQPSRHSFPSVPGPPAGLPACLGSQLQAAAQSTFQPQITRTQVEFRALLHCRISTGPRVAARKLFKGEPPRVSLERTRSRAGGSGAAESVRPPAENKGRGGQGRWRRTQSQEMGEGSHSPPRHSPPGRCRDEGSPGGRGRGARD